MQDVREGFLRPSRKGRVRLSSVVIARSKYLLPTDYKSSQLVTELGIDKREAWRVREWCRRGLPHRHDTTGHIVINGTEFMQWAGSTITHRRHERMPIGYMWCCACNSPQLASEFRIERSSGRARKIAMCSCGHAMSQWVSNKRYE